MSGESERRAGGKAMEANRAAIGKQIKDDLSRIVSITPRKEPLKVLDKRGPLPAKKGQGDWKGAKTGGGGGIASPLSELYDRQVASREYYPGVDDGGAPTYFWSSDYMLAVELKPLKVLRFKDADNQDVELHFLKPEAGAS